MQTFNVLALRADRSGCSHYRIEEPARVVNSSDLGCSVTVQEHLDAETNREGFPVRVECSADIVIFQRPVSSTLVACIPLLQKQGIKCIVEIDDALDALPPNHAGYRNLHPHYSPDSNWQNLKRACLLADHVTVSTPDLLRFAPGQRGTVLRNYVPRWITQIDYVGKCDIGYTGSLHTHPSDHDVIGNVLADKQFHVIGNSAGLQEKLSLENEPTETGWLPIEDYYKSIAELKIGIAPLEDSTFNKAKSWLKCLEYAALSVPFVASPSDEYTRFVGLYGGKTAKRARHWKNAVDSLMSNEDKAREIGEALREQVKQHLTIEENAYRWSNCWKSVLEQK